MRYHFITQHMSQCSGLRFGDIDVPLLTVKEVDISPIANHLSIIPQASKMRTIDWQKNLAENCIAEFGLRISNVLNAQDFSRDRCQQMNKQEGSIMSFSKLFTFEELNSMFRHKIHETGMANLSTSTPSTQDIIGQWTILDSSPNKAPLRQSVDLSHDMEHTNVWSDDSLRNCLGWSDLQNDVGFSGGYPSMYAVTTSQF
jgi:hypothetical protein